MFVAYICGEIGKAVCCAAFFYAVQAFFLLLLSELAVRTEHVHNLVNVHLLHVLTSWLEVLTWVEVAWVLSEVLADSGSHCKT